MHASVLTDLHQNAARAQNMAGGKIAETEMIGEAHRVRFVGRHGVKILERSHCVVIGVERQRRSMLRKVPLVGEGGVFFLQVAGIRQEQMREVDGSAGGPDFAAKTCFHQTRNVSGVVEVGVRQHQPPNAGGLNRERTPIAEPKLLGSLEQSAVNEQPFATGFEQVA